MDSPVGPDGLPAVFEAGAWRSHDRRFWWNGAGWVATPKSGFGLGPWLARIGLVALVVALLGYVVYTIVATKSEYAIGYYVGLLVFFGLIVAVFRFAGRWGCFGIVIRGIVVILGVLRILALIAHPPPS